MVVFNEIHNPTINSSVGSVLVEVKDHIVEKELANDKTYENEIYQKDLEDEWKDIIPVTNHHPCRVIRDTFHLR